MATMKAWLLIIFPSAVAVACSCAAPPNLCSRLEPDMVAFVGRPVQTAQLGRSGVRTTFEIEESLWGVAQRKLISVELGDLRAPDGSRRLFVLAGRRLNHAPDGEDSYLVSNYCCPYGLVLPVDHEWVKEFRSYVQVRRPAVIGLLVKSNFVALPGFDIRIASSEYVWRGVSGASAVNVSLPAGEYTMKAERTHFTVPESAGLRVSILPGACPDLTIPVEPTSSISGTIIGSSGASAAGLYVKMEGEVDQSFWYSPIVELRRFWYWMTGWGGPPAHSTFYVEKPDSDGRFQIRVLPGKYLLSVVSINRRFDAVPPPIPKTYFPGVTERNGATEIVVLPGSAVTNINFRLPD